MASKKTAIDDAKVAAFVRSQVYDAIGYDQTELSQRRVKAIEYYRGELRDIPASEGRSKVTSRDLSDHVGWILPSLMRVFAASDNIVCYEPQEPQDEPFAKQASDYVNYIFWRECNGYRVLWNSFQDALMFGNGVFKFWWETGKRMEFEEYSGLDEAAFIQLVGDDDVEVTEHTVEEKTEEATDPQTGQVIEQPYVCHDVKIKRTFNENSLRIASLPPEEFLIERGATSIEDANFACHRSLRTRQSLIDDGYKREVVMGIGPDYDLQSQPEKVARWNRILYDQNHFESDPLMVEVEVFECYTRLDYDGDGYAEWRKIVIAGISGSEADEHHILSNEEWTDEVPFAEVIPNPDAHIWRGRSLFDDLEDVAKVKTVLTRQTLDNLYLTNIPQREVALKNVKNPDEVINPTIGGAILVDQIGQVREIATPFVADKSYMMLEYQDQTAEKRTGVSRQSMALDPEALQNQTAAGVQAGQSAANSKNELYARNIAEIGLKRLFKCILKLIVRYQDKPRMIRLRNQWVNMDPRSWNADMDATVSVGLGSGSRDRDLMVLQQIAAKQELILAQMGPQNPVVNLTQYANTLRKMVESAGIREPDGYFNEVNPEQMQQFAQQQASKPDPKAQAEMAKAQLEQQKAQQSFQLDQQKAAASLQAQREEAALRLQLDREQSAAQIQMQADKAAAEREQKRLDAVMNAQLRREEMMLEAQLTQQANVMDAAVKQKQADTNIKRQQLPEQ